MPPLKWPAFSPISRRARSRSCRHEACRTSIRRRSAARSKRRRRSALRGDGRLPGSEASRDRSSGRKTGWCSAACVGGAGKQVCHGVARAGGVEEAIRPPAQIVRVESGLDDSPVPWLCRRATGAPRSRPPFPPRRAACHPARLRPRYPRKSSPPPGTSSHPVFGRQISMPPSGCPAISLSRAFGSLVLRKLVAAKAPPGNAATPLPKTPAG